MRTRNVSATKVLVRCLLGLSLWVVCAQVPLLAGQSTAKPSEDKAKTADPDAVEQEALRKALQSTGANPLVLIKNLETFLERFPETHRREIILRTICQEASEANAPAVTIKYGQMLIAMAPEDSTLLSLLLDALDQEKDAAHRTLAIDYSTRLIAMTEKRRSQAVQPDGEDHAEQEKVTRRLATAYARRGSYYEDAGTLDKAKADFEKSYEVRPSARAAECLGDVASAQGDIARAADYYSSAFTFPEKEPDLAHRWEVRRKLGNAYAALHHSDAGLGDLVLARSDELMRQFAAGPSLGRARNADRHNPFDYVLERPNGAPLSLADYHGKVVVLDFWATWCGPCRLEGRLLEQVIERFRNEPAAFLAVNVDEDASRVAAFLKEEKWTVPVAYAQGLDRLLGVNGLPTIMIFDRQGQVVYRQEGVDPEGFVEELGKHLREALQQPTSATASSR